MLYSSNPDRSVIYANLNPFPPVSNQFDNYTVEEIMMDYNITPDKTEIIIIYADLNYNIIDTYTKVLEFYYLKQASFSINILDVSTLQLSSIYMIAVAIVNKTDDLNKPDIYILNLISNFILIIYIFILYVFHNAVSYIIL